MDDYSSLLVDPDENDARTRSAALAAALRRQNTIGQLGTFMQDPSTAAVGQSLSGQATHQLQQLQDLPQARQQYQQGTLKLQQTQKAQDPHSTQTTLGRQLMSRMGLTVPDDASMADIESVAPLAEKAYAAELRGKELLEMMRERRALQESSPVAVQKQLKALSDDLDPNRGRNGTVGDSQKRVLAAKRILALVDQMGGNLDKRQVEELAISLNNMLSGSNTSAQGQTSALVPHTLIGNINGLKEFLLNIPTGTGQQEFVKRMVETTKRERDVSQQAINEALRARLPTYAPLKATHPAEYAAVVRSHGLDPETGMPLEQAQAAQEIQGGPARIQSEDEYNKLPSGTEYIGPDGKRRKKK